MFTHISRHNFGNVFFFSFIYLVFILGRKRFSDLVVAADIDTKKPKLFKSNNQEHSILYFKNRPLVN